MCVILFRDGFAFLHCKRAFYAKSKCTPFLPFYSADSCSDLPIFAPCAQKTQPFFRLGKGDFFNNFLLLDPFGVQPFEFSPSHRQQAHYEGDHNWRCSIGKRKIKRRRYYFAKASSNFRMDRWDSPRRIFPFR